MSALLPTCAVHATTLLAYVTVMRVRDERPVAEVLEVRSNCTRCGSDVGGQPVAEPADVRVLARSIDLLMTEGCEGGHQHEQLAALLALAPPEIREGFGVGHAKRLLPAWKAYGVGLPVARYSCPNCGAGGERRYPTALRCGHEACSQCRKDGCVMCAHAKSAPYENKKSQKPPKTKGVGVWE